MNETKWLAQVWSGVNASSGGIVSDLGEWLHQLERDYDTYIDDARDLGAYKKRSKVWTLIQVYRNGSRRQPENVLWRAPGAFHDLDDLPDYSVPDLIDRLRSDPSVVLAARTLSGHGIRVIVRTPDWWNPEGPDYKTVWKAAGDHILGLVGPLPPGSKLDPQVSDESRVTFPLLIPPGEAGLWNPDAIPIILPPPEPPVPVEVPEIRTPRTPTPEGEKRGENIPGNIPTLPPRR